MSLIWHGYLGYPSFPVTHVAAAFFLSPPSRPLIFNSTRLCALGGHTSRMYARFWDEMFWIPTPCHCHTLTINQKCCLLLCSPNADVIEVWPLIASHEQLRQGGLPPRASSCISQGWTFPEDEGDRASPPQRSYFHVIQMHPCHKCMIGNWDNNHLNTPQNPYAHSYDESNCWGFRAWNLRMHNVWSSR